MALLIKPQGGLLQPRLSPMFYKNCMAAPVQHQQRRLVLHPQQLAQQPLKTAPAYSHGKLSISRYQHLSARQCSSWHHAAFKAALM